MPQELETLDYADWLSGSLESARVIVPLVVAAVSPRSVVDVGCGIGSWLVAFQETGIADVRGVDGPWVDRAQLLFPRERFVAADLREPLELGRRFDLALCLEVAQILPLQAAAPLVRSLAAAADVVLFGAAIPGQGGTGHRNERWPSYWADLFEAEGYVASDPFRRRIWEEPDVKWWFAQNLVCFARPEAVTQLPELGRATGVPLSLVHPGCLAEANARAVEQTPERRFARFLRGRGRQ